MLLINVLNQTMTEKYVLDDYISLVWTERLREIGDFELTLLDSNTLIVNNVLKRDCFLTIKESKRGMIVEDIQYDESEGDGVVKVTGRSLESLLTRRVVDTHRMLEGPISTVYKQMIIDYFINPGNPYRLIPNFIWQDPINTPNSQLNYQISGEDIYTVCKTVADDCLHGFKIEFVDDTYFKFEVHGLKNKTLGNTDNNPILIFSHEMDNIVDSSYVESNKEYKNVAYAGGSENWVNRRVYGVTCDLPDDKYLLRREVTVSTEISLESVGNDNNRYKAALEQAGKNKLRECVKQEVVDTKVSSNSNYVYGVDYEIGDIVELKTRRTDYTSMIISEVVISSDVNEVNIYPTFEKYRGVI